MEEFKVVCVNAQGKPKEIPGHLWVEKDEIYTVIEVKTMRLQNSMLGFVLKEIPLCDDCFPYECFASPRFRPLTEEDEEAAEFAKQAVMEILEMDEIDGY